MLTCPLPQCFFLSHEASFPELPQAKCPLPVYVVPFPGPKLGNQSATFGNALGKVLLTLQGFRKLAGKHFPAGVCWELQQSSCFAAQPKHGFTTKKSSWKKKTHTHTHNKVREGGRKKKRKKLLVSGKRVHKECIIPTMMWIIHVNQ